MMKKTILVLFLSLSIVFLLAANCVKADDKLLNSVISKMEKDKKLTKDEKKLIKESKLINYVVETYGKSIIISKYKVIPEEPEEAPPLILIYVKDPKSKYKSSIDCEMNHDEEGKLDCKPYDTYLTNLLNKEATEYIKPFVKASFGKIKQTVEYSAYVDIVNAKEKKFKFNDTPNYQSLKKKIPVCVSVRFFDKKLNMKAYYDEMFKFIQNFKNNTKGMKIESNCGGVNLFVRGSYKDNFGNADVKAIQLKQTVIDKLKKPNDLKKYTVNSNIGEFEFGYGINIKWSKLKK